MGVGLLARDTAVGKWEQEANSRSRAGAGSLGRVDVCVR